MKFCNVQRFGLFDTKLQKFVLIYDTDLFKVQLAVKKGRLRSKTEPSLATYHLKNLKLLTFPTLSTSLPQYRLASEPHGFHKLP